MSEEELAVLRYARKQLQESLPYMATDEHGSGPDCTGIIQAIINCDALLAKYGLRTPDPAPK